MKRMGRGRQIWYWLVRLWREVVETFVEPTPQPGKLVAVIKDGVYEIVPYRVVRWGELYGMQDR